VSAYAVGSLVQARGREWVVLPQDDPDVLRLRPLGGTEEDVTGIFLPLEGHEVTSATLSLPDPTHVDDHVAAALLRDAVRLGFRSGAGPFRSLGRIAVEPRPYQLVPLLMALRLQPVRLLIGDDVGIGKTVEAAVIARELLDRGEIHRLCVLCPPHLCEQWQQELSEKFHIEAEVVRPGTVARLERPLDLARSIFDEYPFVVVSIDYIKSDRRRADFVRACPEFVIVDEAHTCSRPAAAAGAQHQRHSLVAELARDPNRHLVLVTATPHSGDEQAFASLVGLLDASLGQRIADQGYGAGSPNRAELARIFVQRRRADLREYLGSTSFPERDSKEEVYKLTPEYQKLLNRVLDYAQEVVEGAAGLSQFRQRVCWWAALALLRCASSSPAAAAAALRTRALQPERPDPVAADRLGATVVMDLESQDEATQDDSTPGGDTTEGDELETAERRRLRTLAREFDSLAGAADPKLSKAATIVEGLLREGYRPIVFCRYISTAKYVAEELGKRLRDIDVRAVTGELPPEERAARVEELAQAERRVLVATDCLAEGINLQHSFDAVLHYDLSWNPTRHEQREGRVDRYGQPSPKVRTVMFYGENNAVDGAVLKVLLRKAETIRKNLGISVPVPVDSTAVLEAIFDSLFHSRNSPQQLSLDLDMAEEQLEREWQLATEREKRTRTVFAQAGLKPEVVATEWQENAFALGTAEDVQRFLREACDRLGSPLVQRNSHWELDTSRLPAAITSRLNLATDRAGRLRLAFHPSVPAGVIYISRTHPLIESVAGYLLETALEQGEKAAAKRAGAIRTNAVRERTVFLLLRARYLIEQNSPSGYHPMLAEESLLTAFRGPFDNPIWLDDDEASALLSATPTADVAPGQISLWVKQVEDAIPAILARLKGRVRDRAESLLAAHRRVRDVAGLRGVRYRVQPELPVDVLGIYVLMPAPPGIGRGQAPSTGLREGAR